MRLVVVAALVVQTGRASADDAACSTEVVELREHLSAQQGRANTWNWAWRITFTTAAVGTLAVGLANPFPSLQQGLFASSGKATIGALARWILPLRIHVPDASADACADVALLRKEVRRIAKRQRSLFWMGHFGGIVVNLAGAAYVYYYDGLGKAALSVAIGYPIGLFSNYTMPRATWKLFREREAAWSVTAVTAAPRAEGGWVLSLGGTF